MSLDRRELLTISGVAGVGALAGCYAISETVRDDGTLWGEEGERRLPEGLETLHIRAGDVHVIGAGDVESYGMIRWAAGGELRVEPDGAIAMADITNA